MINLTMVIDSNCVFCRNITQIMEKTFAIIQEIFCNCRRLDSGKCAMSHCMMKCIFLWRHPSVVEHMARNACQSCFQTASTTCDLCNVRQRDRLLICVLEIIPHQSIMPTVFALQYEFMIIYYSLFLIKLSHQGPLLLIRINFNRNMDK